MLVDVNGCEWFTHVYSACSLNQPQHPALLGWIFTIAIASIAIVGVTFWASNCYGLQPWQDTMYHCWMLGRFWKWGEWWAAPKVQVKVDTESTTTSLRVNGLVCVVAIHSGAVCTKTGGVTFPKRYFGYFYDVYIYINVYILYIYI